MRLRLCAASSPRRNEPSALRSKLTPKRTRSSIAAGPARTMRSTEARSQRPSPAASVSAICKAGSSSGPTAAATPPCARMLDVSAPSRALLSRTTGSGARMQRRDQPGQAAADDDGTLIDAFHVHDEHPTRYQTANIRSTESRALSAIAGSIVTSCCIVSSARRMFLSVIRFICGQRLQGRMNSSSGY